MASVKQVADLAGVSMATVSRVLNARGQVHPDTRGRVLAAAQELGYKATFDRSGVCRIAVVYPGPVWLCGESPFDIALVQGVSRAMSEFDFDLTVIDLRRTMHEGEAYRDFFRRKGISGVIMRSDDTTLGVCEQIALEGVPAVMLGERSENPAVSYVSCDSRVASREIVDHLIGLGHQRIALCCNNQFSSDHRDRIQGWRESLESHSLEAGDDLILQSPATIDNGAALLRRILSMNDRPTGVYVNDPLLAVGVIKEAHWLGVEIPGELSVAGFDDSSLRFLTVPEMTCVCQDAVELGRRAVAVLRKMTTEEVGGPIRLQTAAWVEVRGSTGPAPERRMASRPVVTPAQRDRVG